MIPTADFTELFKWTHFLGGFFFFSPRGENFKAFLNFGKGRVITMYLSWQKHYYYFITNRDLFVKNKNYPFRCNLKYEKIGIFSVFNLHWLGKASKINCYGIYACFSHRWDHVKCFFRFMGCFWISLALLFHEYIFSF